MKHVGSKDGSRKRARVRDRFILSCEKAEASLSGKQRSRHDHNFCEVAGEISQNIARDEESGACMRSSTFNPSISQKPIQNRSESEKADSEADFRLEDQVSLHPLLVDQDEVYQPESPPKIPGQSIKDFNKVVVGRDVLFGGGGGQLILPQHLGRNCEKSSGGGGGSESGGGLSDFSTTLDPPTAAEDVERTLTILESNFNFAVESPQ